jgi:hypothetical protein
MQGTLLLHVLAGGLALAFGYTALFAEKGGTTHRRTGKLFVGAMLVMAVAGLAVSLGRGVAPSINGPAALWVSYWVVTSLATVRPPKSIRAFHLGAALFATTLGAIQFGLAIDATRQGTPGFAQVLLGVGALAMAASDYRIARDGLPAGTRRLSRHLWRMCAALLVAALSLFIGQSDELPDSLRIYPLLALPPLVVLGIMIAWLRRLRAGRVPAPPGR